MKRPLATVGLSYVAVCALAAGLPGRVCLALAVVTGALGALALLSRHKARGYAVCILLAASCAFTALLLAGTLQLSRLEGLETGTAQLSGTVTEVNSAKSIVVRGELGLSVAVYAREPLDVRVGERFTALVALSRYEDGDDSPDTVARARETPLRAFVLNNYEAQPPQGGATALLYRMRMRFMEVLFTRYSPENTGLLCAVLLGERQYITEGASDAWYGSGIGHLIAISGYHVTLLTSLALGTLRLLRLPRRLCAVLTGGAVVCYMALVGFTGSVQRAGIMALFVLAASVLDREADALTSLAAAGLIICLPSPFAAASTGFLLSFLATLALILFAKPLQNWMEEHLGPARFPRVRSFFTAAMAAGLCGYGATLPVSMLTFTHIPLYGPITNLLIAPLVPVVIGCGMLSMLVGAVPVVGALSIPLAAVSGAACTLVTEVARFIAGLPFAQPPVGAGFLTLWMAGGAVLVAVAAFRPTRRKTQACALLCVITLMVGVLSYQFTMRGAVRLTVIATESSTAFVAVKDGYAAIVGDVRTGADAYKVQRVLERYSVRGVELVALLPVERDRMGAVSALLLDYDVAVAVLGEADRDDERMRQALGGAAVYEWERTETMTFLDGERVMLAPGGIFAEFEGIKAFILFENCDILNSILTYGAPTVAAVGPRQPAEVKRLWSRWLVSCGGARAGFIAEEILPLAQWETADFLLKDGRARLLK